jgi:hypothetical protein
MSFWSTLESDVNKGLETAAVVVGTFLPQYGSLLQDIAIAVQDIETVFARPISSVPEATVSAVTQAVTTVNVIKQAAAAKSS